MMSLQTQTFAVAVLVTASAAHAAFLWTSVEADFGSSMCHDQAQQQGAGLPGVLTITSSTHAESAEKAPHVELPCLQALAPLPDLREESLALLHVHPLSVVTEESATPAVTTLPPGSWAFSPSADPTFPMMSGSHRE